MKRLSIAIISIFLLYSQGSHAKFGVQLPFIDGDAHECVQNSDDKPSHKISITKYDLDFGGMSQGQTLLVAAAGGTVEKVVWWCSVGTNCGADDPGEGCNCGSGFGNHIKIKHDDNHSTLYGHLKYGGVIVEKGDTVIAGQPIGFAGNTGISTGPHLHFGMHVPDENEIGDSIDDMEIWSKDRNTGEDMWRLVGVDRDDPNAFTCQKSVKHDGVFEPGHEYEAIDINGFSESPFQCAGIEDNQVHCWRGEYDETGRVHSAECTESNHHLKYSRPGVFYHSEELSTAEGVSLCANHTGPISLTMYLTSGIGGGIDPSENTDNTDGTPYPDPTDGQDTSGQTSGQNLIGFHSMRYGDYSKDDWDYGPWEGYLSERASKTDFRVKFSEKNGSWPSNQLCVRLYYSHNSYFSMNDDDPLASWKCESFDHGDDKQSMYFEDIYLPNDMEPSKNYYVFAVAKDENGRILDISTKGDETEYVKYEILPNEYNLALTNLTANSTGGVAPNHTLAITATLQNQLQATQESVEIEIWFNGYIQTYDFGRLAQGEIRSRSFTFTSPALQGTYEIRALADPDGRIHETDGNNNLRTTTVEVLGQYDFAVADVTPSSEPVYLEEPFTLITRVESYQQLPPGTLTIVHGFSETVYGFGSADASTLALRSTDIVSTGVVLPFASLSEDVYPIPIQTCIYSNSGWFEEDTQNNCLTTEVLATSVANQAPSIELDPACPWKEDIILIPDGTIHAGTGTRYCEGTYEISTLGDVQIIADDYNPLDLSYLVTDPSGLIYLGPGFFAEKGVIFRAVVEKPDPEPTPSDPDPETTPQPVIQGTY